MKNILSILALLLCCAASHAATLMDIVPKGKTDRSVTIRIIDFIDGTPETAVEHDTAGIDLWYRREGAAKTSITEAALAALTTVHTDGGIEAVGNGEYRLDLPDAAFATGANYVDVGGTVTGMIVTGGRVRLTDFDIEDADPAADVTKRLGVAVVAEPPNYNLLNIGRDGAVATSNRGYMSNAKYGMPFASGPAKFVFVRAPSGAGGLDGTSAADAYASIEDAITDVNLGGFASYKIDHAGDDDIDAATVSIPANTWLAGDGVVTNGVWSGTSQIRSSVNGASTPIISAAGDNVLIQGVKATWDGTPGNFAACFGYGSGQTPTRNVVVIDSAGSNDSDAIYFRGTSDASPINGWWRFYNMDIDTKWDASVIIGENATHITEIYDSNINVDGPSGVVSATDIRAIAGTGGTQRLFNNTINAVDPQAGDDAIAVHTRGAMLVEVYGGTVNGEDSDFETEDRGQIIVRGTEYDGTVTGNIIVLEDGLDWSKIRTKGATVALPATTVGTLTTYTGNTPQTGDTYGLANGASGFAAIVTAVGDVPTNAELNARSILADDYFVPGDYTVPPSAVAIADAISDEPLAGHTTAGTSGKAWADAQSAGDPWATALPGAYSAGQAGKIVGDNLDAQVSEAGGGGAPSDLNIEPVPTSRLFTLTRKATGLVGEGSKTIQIGGGAKTYGVDFRNDAATNQRIYSVESIAILTGTAGGITFGDAADYGRYSTQAIASFTPVTAGDYVVRVIVRYGSASGPTATGDIEITLIP